MKLPINPKWNKRFLGPVTFGQLILGIYVIAVLMISLLHDATGQPTIAQLASSPQALMQGKWWSLITSGFIVDGPPIPQLATIVVLGVLGIYFHGAWAFWRTAIFGHLAGTLMTYGAIGLVWLSDPQSVAHLLVDPDYGVSLVWCAGLGALAATVMLDNVWMRPWKRLSIIWGSVLIFMLTTILSAGIAVYEHIAAFAIGAVVIMSLPKTERARVHSAAFGKTGSQAV